MKPYSRFSLPDWLFKPRKSMDYTSSTVAAFSPEEGIKSEDGFKGSMLPGPDADQLDKMTLLINDPTLRYEDAHSAVETAHTIHRLIQNGFQIYIIREGRSQLLATTADLSEGDILDSEKAAEILVRDTHIPRDDIVVCNDSKIQKLCQRQYEARKDKLEKMAINNIQEQWLATHTLPLGQNLPAIEIKEISSLDPEFNEALAASDINYTITSFDLKNPSIKYLKPKKVKKIVIDEFSHMQVIATEFHHQMSLALLEHPNIEHIAMKNCEFEREKIIDIPVENRIKTINLEYCSSSAKFLNRNTDKLSHARKLTLNRSLISGSNSTILLKNVEDLTLINEPAPAAAQLLSQSRGIKYLRIFIDAPQGSLNYLNSIDHLQLKNLSIGNFSVNQQELINLVESQPNLEILELCTLEIYGLSQVKMNKQLPSLKALNISCIKYYNTDESLKCVISSIIENSPNIRSIIINKPRIVSEYRFHINKKGHEFKSLETLDLNQTDFELDSVKHILCCAHKTIKSVNISFDADKINSKMNSSALYDAAIELQKKGAGFEEIEELFLCGLTIGADELFTIIKLMPKLRILDLRKAKIQGEPSSGLNINPIIDFNLADAAIEHETLKCLIRGSTPIAIRFMGCTYSGFGGYESVLKTTAHVDFSTKELILLNVKGDKSIRDSAYLDMYPRLRSLDIADSEGSPIWFREDETYPYVYKLSILGCKLQTKHIIAILKAAPNIKTLDMYPQLIDVQLLKYIKESNMRHKVSLFEYLNKYLKAYHEIESNNRSFQAVDLLSHLTQDETPPSDIIRGHKAVGAVYDCMADRSNTVETLDSPSSTPSYQLTPMFKHMSGTDLQFENVRLYAYVPDFVRNTSAVFRAPIVCHPLPYTIAPCTHEYPAVYERTAYDTPFHDADSALGLHRPWIRLHSLTANDELLSLSINMNPTDYDICSSEPDGFYYLMLKNSVPRPIKVTLSYQLSAFKPPCYALPASIKAKRKPFYQVYMSPAPAAFALKNIREKLADIIAHPEHHACGVRADAFLSMIERNNDIQGYRGAGSGLHGWAEIKYDGIWYTVDLGGAPADMEYLPDNQQASAPVQSLVPAQAVSVVARKPDPRLQLEHQLASSEDNTNILVICRKDTYRDHLKSVRRYLLSLSPEASTVVDTYYNALSSVPYIALNTGTQTWYPVDPVGADGWLAHRMPQTERVIIDWSSLSDNQSTKMNSAIDLNDRQIDGVAIKPGVKVISLICEDDHRLKDSSFLSRHSQAINLTGVYIEPKPFDAAEATDKLQTIHIELYNSPQWQKLILGSLGFDDNGKPTHANQALLPSDKPLHIIINNPPEHCEAFERFIHDLQDGHEFKYCDQSIRLPRMQVSLTHGYDFAILKDAVQSLNIDVTADQLQSIEIDHVLTPSTFERCLETRSIVDGKLNTSPGWLYSASSEKPLSLYITKTLSKQQYCYLLKSAKKQSLHLYCAPGVVLPRELEEIPRREYTSAPFYKGDENSQGGESIFDVSELTADDILYRFEYKHDIKNKRFTFSEKISDIWKKLEKGEDVILTGVFSDELMDHLATLLLPKPYLWHDGKKKTFKGKLILKPTVAIEPTSRPEPIHIKTEAERKPELLKALNNNPAVFIEGKPGIGKSCFIREIKADTTRNCYSFDAFNMNTLQEWAASNEDKPAILFIDEATIRGTDWSIFKGLYTPKREILIDGQIYSLTDNHKVVFIGNRVKQMPALLKNELIPTLQFDTLTRDYVIHTILAPIFAEVDKESALQKASAHYDVNKSVREMQGEAISCCASEMNQCRGGLTPQAYPPSGEAPTRAPYHLTANRQPIFDAIITSLHARQFMQQASADSAKYGGQTGHMLEGLPGLGKSDIIHAAMLSARYEEVTNLNELHEAGRDHRFRYYRIPATCSIQNLRKHLRQAFDQGCIVHIDELDALLKPDTPEKEGEVLRLIAELNAYLMGEDLEHNRPAMPGFMLLATGNGITYHGRAALPDSLKSRLHQHAVNPYTKEECQWIIARKYPGLNASQWIAKFVKDPKGYTFRDLMADCRALTATGCTPKNDMPHGIAPFAKGDLLSHTAAPIIYHFYNTRAFRITMPGVLVGVSLGLSLAYTSTFNSIPIIAGLSIAGAMTASIIAACSVHVAQQSRDHTRSQSVSLGALA